MQIKTHKMRNTYNQPHFFILSKGNNSGKPLETPCPNCFVCICKDETEKQQLYWLFYGLWQGMFFHPFLTGSVIPFIRLDDVKQVLKTSLAKIEMNPHEFNLNISVLQQLDQHAILISKQLSTIKQAKKALMYKVLK